MRATRPVCWKDGDIWACEMLIRYGKRDDVRQALIANFTTEGWTGPASAHYTNKKQELLDFKKNTINENISLWVDEFVEFLDDQIERAKIDEERRY